MQIIAGEDVNKFRKLIFEKEEINFLQICSFFNFIERGECCYIRTNIYLGNYFKDDFWA